MQKVIQMTEDELNVLLSRAMWAGVCIQHKHPEVTDSVEKWQDQRDFELKTLKRYSGLE